MRFNSNSRNKTYFFVALIVIIFGTLLVVDNPLQNWMRAGARGAASIAWTMAQGVQKTFDSLGGFSSRATLVEEIKVLEDEIARLESLSLHNDVLRSENATLRDMFSLREAHPEGIAVSVLSNPATSPFGTFVIGSGTAEGIKKGDFVLTAPRVALGRVVSVDEKTALVKNYSAPGYKTEVMVNDIRATYIGRGDGNGEFTLPRSIEIAVGDAAHLPGLPYAIGFVGAIQKNPEDAEATILVRIPANLPSLSFVYVVPGE